MSRFTSRRPEKPERSKRGAYDAYYDPSAEMRKATIASITTDTINAEDDGPRGVATTLRARLGQSRVLTAGEEAYSTRSYFA